MPQQWILTWAQQQWIRITRMLLGVCPPTRRSKRRLRGTLAHWGTPADWPSTIDASQLDVIDVESPFEAQGRGLPLMLLSSIPPGTLITMPLSSCPAAFALMPMPLTKPLPSCRFRY